MSIPLRWRGSGLGILFFVTVLAGCEQPDTDVAIHEAARSGQADRVSVLLNGDPTLIESRDGDGMTPLHQAVLGGQTEVAETLLNRGADISAMDAQARTALHHAANAGDAEAVSLLLARGSDFIEALRPA